MSSLTCRAGGITQQNRGQDNNTARRQQQHKATRQLNAGIHSVFDVV
jgi:hypothetical protein